MLYLIGTILGTYGKDMGAKLRTYYDELQVTENASPEVIKGAYKFLTQKYHPDKNKGEEDKSKEVLQIISKAYKVLSNPESRKEHDAWIKNELDNAQQQAQSSESYSDSWGDKQMPDEIKGWGWGAFFLHWIWCVFNGGWYPLLVVILSLFLAQILGLYSNVSFFIIWIIFILYLGFKGREIAWKRKDWDSVEHFNKVQREWSSTGFLFMGPIYIFALWLVLA